MLTFTFEDNKLDNTSRPEIFHNLGLVFKRVSESNYQDNDVSELPVIFKIKGFITQ